MYKFRVFVSYSHEDWPLAEQLIDVLKNITLGRETTLQPIWDADIRPGMPFTDAIKGLIMHAHIFMPLITPNSQQRPWVHQETGYAMALNIPVLPVVVGNLPGEMIAQLQAIPVKLAQENPHHSLVLDREDLIKRLAEAKLEQVVLPPPAKPHAIVEIADWPETRTELLAQYANRVMDLGSYGLVRQRGAFSSFCLPDKDLHHPIWQAREGLFPRSHYYHHLQRAERIALERHARECGCKLILDPTINLSKNGPTVKKARLETLVEFLDSMPEDKVQVVLRPRTSKGNLTIVGDWFVAESQVPRPREGYRQTVFSWHAPTVLQWVRRFDQEFAELCAQSEKGANKSGQAAIDEIKEIIKTLPQDKGTGSDVE